MLELSEVCVWYGRRQILHDIELTLEPGECVAVIGSNGAGKTTIARALARIGGRTYGRIAVDGIDLLAIKAHKVARAGLALVPERGGLLSRMTVLENLRLSLESAGRARPGGEDRLAWCYELFPRLKERSTQRAATLSGGERRMLLLSRAIVSGAQYLVLDEPSLGLMPSLTTELLTGVVPRMIREGMAVLLIEQNAEQALSIAARAYVLERGRVVAQGQASTLLASDMVRSAYLGI